MNSIYDELTRFSPDGLIHDNERLKELQALPLHKKIGITIARITEWYKAFNGNVYVSLSGGKDSTVLWDIVHKLFPDVPGVFSNTGLEYPEIQQFAKNICTDVVSPQMSFTEVIKTYGYPLISKEVSEAIYYARRNTPPRREAEWKRLELTGNRPQISRDKYWADKQFGRDSNSWGGDRIAQEQITGQTVRTPPLDSRPIENEQNFTDNDRTHIKQESVRRKMLRGGLSIQMAVRNLFLIKKSGCHSSIFHLKYHTTVAM